MLNWLCCHWGAHSHFAQKIWQWRWEIIMMSYLDTFTSSLDHFVFSISTLSFISFLLSGCKSSHSPINYSTVNYGSLTKSIHFLRGVMSGPSIILPQADTQKFRQDNECTSRNADDGCHWSLILLRNMRCIKSKWRMKGREGGCWDERCLKWISALISVQCHGGESELKHTCVV